MPSSYSCEESEVTFVGIFIWLPYNTDTIVTQQNPGKHPSIQYLSQLILCRVTGGPEPIPADIRPEAGSTLEVLPIHHKAPSNIPNVYNLSKT